VLDIPSIRQGAIRKTIGLAILA